MVGLVASDGARWEERLGFHNQAVAAFHMSYGPNLGWGGTYRGLYRGFGRDLLRDILQI